MVEDRRLTRPTLAPTEPDSNAVSSWPAFFFEPLTCAFRKWRLRYAFQANDLWQCSHVYGFSPVWMREWRTMLLRRLNRREQEPHSNGFSRVCTRSWSCIFFFSMNAFRQIRHLCGFSFVWMRSWRTQLHFSLNRRSQNRHSCLYDSIRSAASSNASMFVTTDLERLESEKPLKVISESMVNGISSRQWVVEQGDWLNETKLEMLEPEFETSHFTCIDLKTRYFLDLRLGYMEYIRLKRQFSLVFSRYRHFVHNFIEKNHQVIERKSKAHGTNPVLSIYYVIFCGNQIQKFKIYCRFFSSFFQTLNSKLTVDFGFHSPSINFQQEVWHSNISHSSLNLNFHLPLKCEVHKLRIELIAKLIMNKILVSMSHNYIDYTGNIFNTSE